jgi:hypothetical protein
MHHQRNRRFVLLIACAASAVLASAPSVARADACAADPAPAKCYKTQADGLREANPSEAAALYLKSYKLDPKIDPLAGYGFALALDNQHAAAADVLAKAAEEYEKVRAKLEADNSDANVLFQVIHRLEFVQGERKKLVAKIGQVRLKVADNKLPLGITVTRKNGGDLRGSDPTLLFVNANSDHLVFTYASGKTLDHEVNVPAGTISTVEIPPEPRDAPPPPPPPKPIPDPSIGTRRFAYIAGGVGGVALVGGLGYLVLADVPSAGLGAGIAIAGGAGIGVAIYLIIKADKQRKAWRLEQPTTTPAPDAEEEEAEEEAMLVPMITGDAIGAAWTGRF